MEHHLLASGKLVRLFPGIAKPLVIKLKISHKPGQVRVCLVLCTSIRIQIKIRIQPAGRHGADGAFFRNNIFPECRCIVGIRVDTAHSDNGDFIIDLVFPT